VRTKADKREAPRDNTGNKKQPPFLGPATLFLFKVLYTFSEPKISKITGVSMTYKRSRRKPDLLSLLLIAVVVGMSLTLAYQVNLYYGSDSVPIANQAPGAEAADR
jgi:hypothetical protein